MQIKGRIQDSSWYKEAILSVLKQNYSLFKYSSTQDVNAPKYVQSRTVKDLCEHVNTKMHGFRKNYEI